MGADEEARGHIAAFGQRLHEFHHQTKEHELELWDQRSKAMDLPRMELLMAKN